MSTPAVPDRPDRDRAAEGWRHSSILVVDDEQGMRNFLEKTLAPRCGEVHGADSAEAAEALIRTHRYDLLILDIALPGKNGIALLRDLREQGYSGEVILITAFADLDTAIEALRAGASDFILKPFRVTQLLNSVQQSLERARLARENYVLRRTISQRTPPFSGLVGHSPVMQQLQRALQRVAQVTSTVLLSGESGTGKELAALALHRNSPRANGPFVPVNCATMSPELIESELFGHAKGAFTGATKSRDGLFYYAQGGTLFLDEIGELPLSLQAALLRVLDDRRIRPVGSEQQVPVDVRIIAATNRSLAAEVAAGRFRADLYYRLQVVEIALPPLREHKEDIPDLVEHFIATLAPQLGVEPIEVTPEELEYLQQYHWPGNVRELRNLIERSLILGSLNVSALYQSLPAARPYPGTATDLHTLEKQHILAVLESVQGDKTRAAKMLGISRRTLERRCAEWSVS
ncbi:sigma-54-dependent transcriptional regulator [Caldimonas thermodepolymerans]|uniref:sigma-54-dependent transcriptional regulator n=1 Tax=Caldimonas thermodepolymerans TaxID=215580 RepID=UPI001E5AB598|nr:sigma-54 dependent transcriptional regulator [Caldimonas thermodepolymerans]UZG43433.1 sigma-54 dependent transcriptional regulator [Caldimonas thermodepolymerans]UZG47100.1 sigma-54 dependent transcriptional regulator [Caldimonas thermodepolymerans]